MGLPRRLTDVLVWWVLPAIVAIVPVALWTARVRGAALTLPLSIVPVRVEISSPDGGGVEGGPRVARRFSTSSAGPDAGDAAGRDKQPSRFDHPRPNGEESEKPDRGEAPRAQDSGDHGKASESEEFLNAGATLYVQDGGFGFFVNATGPFGRAQAGGSGSAGPVPGPVSP